MATATKDISSTKNVFDSVLDLYGSIDYLFTAIDDNGIETIEEDIPVGTSLIYDDELVFLTNPTVEEDEDTSAKTLIVKPNQTVFDVALQVYGDVQYLFSLTEENEVITSLNENISGLSLAYTEQAFAVTDYFRKNSINITTGNINGDEDLARAYDDSFDLSFG